MGHTYDHLPVCVCGGENAPITHGQCVEQFERLVCQKPYRVGALPGLKMSL